MWLDIRATLRSDTRPVSKHQQWSVDPNKRIVLHLESFYPAVHAPSTSIESHKRPRLETESPAPSRALLPPVSANGPGPARGGMHDAGPSYNRGPSPPYAPGQAVPPGPAGPPAPPLPSHHGAPPGREPVPFDSRKRPAHDLHPDDEFRRHPPISRHSDVADRRDLVRPSWTEAPERNVPSRSPEEEAKSVADERHRAGMANLYARGVTDAMIKKWYVGWNGKTLVYPRYDSYGRFIELDLGPRIEVAPDDEDGTRFIRMRLDQEQARLRREAELREAADMRARHLDAFYRPEQTLPPSPPPALPPREDIYSRRPLPAERAYDAGHPSDYERGLPPPRTSSYSSRSVPSLPPPPPPPRPPSRPPVAPALPEPRDRGNGNHNRINTSPPPLRSPAHHHHRLASVAPPSVAPGSLRALPPGLPGPSGSQGSGSGSAGPPPPPGPPPRPPSVPGSSSHQHPSSSPRSAAPPSASPLEASERGGGGTSCRAAGGAGAVGRYSSEERAQMRAMARRMRPHASEVEIDEMVATFYSNPV